MTKSKPILRSFIYLDEDAVDDYLSQLEGGILEGPYTTETNSSGGKEGRLRVGFHGAEAGVSGRNDHTEKVTQQVKETPGAKFSRLYNLLRENELIQDLSGFDQGIYDQIEQGEIIELRGQARLTQWDHIIGDIETFVKLADVMKQAGQDPTEDPTVRQIINIMPDLKAATGSDKALLIVTPINGLEFKFVVTMTPTKLRRPKEECETEITILGKIQRKLARGEKIEVFRLLPRLNALQKLNRNERRRGGNRLASPTSTDSPYDEIIKYPAIELTPVAIYL